MADRPFDMAQPVLDMGEVPLGGGRGTSLQIWRRTARNGRRWRCSKCPKGFPRPCSSWIPGTTPTTH
ncbi:MAG: hypothetical protein R3E96_05260 [Planctomycetota bacterium]